MKLTIAATASAILILAGCDMFTSAQDVQKSTNSPPSIPTNLQLTPTPAEILATWDITPNTGFYRIYWTDDGTEPSISSHLVDSIDGTFYDHMKLDWLKTYTYKVSAVNQVGASQLSDPVAAKPLIAPLSTPGGISASVGDPTSQINLDWNSLTELGVYYSVFRRNSTGKLGSSALIADNVLESDYSDRDIKLGSGYFYKVKGNRPSTQQQSDFSQEAYGFTWGTVTESEPNNPPSPTHDSLWSSFGNDASHLDCFYIKGGYSTAYSLYDSISAEQYDYDYYIITLFHGDEIRLNLLDGTWDPERGVSIALGEVFPSNGVLQEQDVWTPTADGSFKFSEVIGRINKYAYLRVTMRESVGRSYVYSLQIQITRAKPNI